MLNFIIIGFGFVGQKHFQAIAATDFAEVVAIVDPRVGQGMIGNVPVYNSIQDLPSEVLKQDPIAIIATPNDTHIALAIQCLRLGLDALVEKPLALHLVDAEQLKLVCNETGRTAFCMLQNRFTPHGQFIKDAVANSLFGKVKWVEVSAYWNREEQYYKGSDWKGNRNRDGGALFTQFSHFVDLLVWLFGEIEISGGKTFKLKEDLLTSIEDTGTFTFSARSDVHGIFTYSTATPRKNHSSKVLIMGTENMLTVQGQYLDEIQWLNLVHAPVEAVLPFDDARANYYNQLRMWRGGQDHSLPSLEEAIHSVRIIEDFYNLANTQ